MEQYSNKSSGGYKENNIFNAVLSWMLYQSRNIHRLPHVVEEIVSRR